MRRLENTRGSRGALCLGLLLGCSEPKDSTSETGDDDGWAETGDSSQYPNPCRDLYENFDYEPGCEEARGCLPSGVTVDDDDSLAVTLTCVPDPDGQLCPATCAGADPCLNNGISVAYESGVPLGCGLEAMDVCRFYTGARCCYVVSWSEGACWTTQ